MHNPHLNSPPFSVKCSKCNEEYPEDPFRTSCERCNSVLSLNYDWSKLNNIDFNTFKRRVPSVWKYFELLPLKEGSTVISLGEGGTHLHECQRLQSHLKIKKLLLKDETTNPTASFLDRGSTVVISRALETGARAVSCGATGNLGASISAYAAKAGLEAIIFIPKILDPGKLYQMIAFGAKVELSKDYSTAISISETYNKTHFIVSPINPYFMEGQKTIGYEMIEQMGWKSPDRIIVPMGNGILISMIWKALNEFFHLGLINNINTKLTGIQTSAVSPIVDAFNNGGNTVCRSGKGDTIALDIGIEVPLAGELALNAIKSSGGTCITVNDNEILDATSLLAKSEGVFAEPSAASSIAGLKKMLDTGLIERDEEVVCVLTGAGLKNPITSRQLLKSKHVRTIVRKYDDRYLTTHLGETKLRILQILYKDDVYGYKIRKDLDDLFQISVKIPVIYQHLKELENMNLVRRSRVYEVGGRPERTYYSITGKGKAATRYLKIN